MAKVLFSFLALLGLATSFPSVLQPKVMQPRAASGCSVSSQCNRAYSVSNSQIGLGSVRTPAQVASAARQNCGALTPCATFDATEQYVSTSGQYAFQSPSKSQIRGPCPGLNAAANHGYLPRSGVASITQTIVGLGQAYGMSPDLAGFLAAYAIVFDGDLLTQTWSIGGPQPSIGIPGKAQGISWSHNKYEGDSSISRCDAYINNGDAHSLSTARFSTAYKVGMSNDRYTMDLFDQDFTKKTFQSVSQNPEYFAPLFSTTLVSPAAYHFVIAMMSNHTAQDIGGYLDGNIFKTFFAVTGDYPNFVWHPGQERIPDNWYRRPTASQYTAHTGVFGDLAAMFAAYPSSFRFGGNTNGVNTYEGVDLANFTNGVYNSQNLFQGDNFACFTYQTIQQGIPDFVSGGTGTLSGAVSFLNPYLNAVFGGLSCPKVSKFNDNNLPGQYPGHNYSPDGPANNC